MSDRFADVEAAALHVFPSEANQTAASGRSGGARGDGTKQCVFCGALKPASHADTTMTADLRERLGYRFRRPELLVQALTHRSYGARHNERLEFVGDAVLNCVVAHSLYERFPEIDEGALSRVRASLVNRDALAEVAKRLGMGEAILLGEGEQRSGGPGRPSILADALEALYGAVFLDGGFDAAHEVIDRTFGDLLRDADPAILGKDPKTQLQEWLQARRLPVPDYRIVEIGGEAHAQRFTVQCTVPALDVATQGIGNSRRAAEQAAATSAYAIVATAGSGRQAR